MDLFYDKYAEAVISSLLSLGPDDILSINTEEEDASFAKLLAKKAKQRSGNGSYIQRIEDGKVVEEYDFLSSFPLRKTPTLFVYIPLFKPFPELDVNATFDAPLLQRFRLLSDPLGSSVPALPFVTCPLPSPQWDEMTEEYGSSSLSLLYAILGMEDDDYLKAIERRNNNSLYQKEILNKLRLKECRIANDEGTDISFSFLPSSSFHSSYLETAEGRKFSPYPISGDIFRLIDPVTLSGWINISKPISLFGKRIPSLSIRFEGGKVSEYTSSPLGEALFGLYLSQEPTAGRASMVTISEISNPLYDEDLTFIPELDRIRTVSVTIGGPKGEAVEEDDIDNTVDSLLSLSLPLGSESTVMTALGEDGEEYTIYSGGYIMDDEEEE